MRKQYLILLLLFGMCVSAYAQSPELTVDGKTGSGVRLQSLRIDINVCGTVARTSWTMTFLNTTNRILEGNLNFPLKEGVTVNRYALDINGRMREAVPVDRGKGAVVFEAIERRRVDPGLLEKLDGNVFRTRIYPINPGSTRTVIIGYDEQLPLLPDNALRYYLPLSSKDTVADFSLHINTIQVNTQPVFDSTLSNSLQFDKTGNSYTASFNRKNFVAASPVSFRIPKPADATDVVMQAYENKFCYLVNIQLPAASREKPQPHRLAVIWDASLSATGNNIEKELAFLDGYFKKIGNATIQFEAFADRPRPIRQFILKDGNWEALRNYIAALPYDGATNFSKLNLPAMDAEEYLLFSDGRQTVGQGNLYLPAKPVYCINSSASADFSRLRKISNESGGELIDLLANDSAAAQQKISQQAFRFLGIKNNTGILEHYPAVPVAVSGSFTLSGMVDETADKLVMQFGYGKTVTLEKTIRFDPDAQLCENFDITKLYAQQKIAELDMNYNANRTEIEYTGKTFGIVTRNTSLIVLETLNDYLTYQIEPPAELRDECYRILKERQPNVITKNKDNTPRINETTKDLLNWYNKKFLAKKNDDNKPVTVTTPAPPPVTVAVVTPTPQPVAPQNTVNNDDGRTRLIEGIVTDESGRPVPGATVAIRQGRTGTSTDNLGKFSLRVKSGDALQVASVGYETNMFTITDRSSYTTILRAQNTMLEEVVVTGYGGVKRKAETLSYATSAVSSEGLTTARYSNVNEALAGKIAGVQVSSETEAKLGAVSKIRLRGVTNFNEKASLMILDGREVTSLAGYDVNSFGDVQVYKGPAATAIFGQRAEDGVILITTKDFKADSVYRTKVERLNRDSGARQGIVLKYNPETTDYMRIIRQAGKEARYEKYLDMRMAFKTDPAYYFRMGEYFVKTGERETGLTILSNLAEMENANYELYKMLGYKLKEAGDYEGELNAFEKVTELRPLDPQSFRDYALALEDNGRYQESLDMLQKGLEKAGTDEMIQLYNGIEEIFISEISRLVTKYRKQLNLSKVNEDLILPFQTDLRVVINWNKNNTDIDLWVTDPNGEKCFYSHNATEAGGRISRDFTRGFGPEQFVLRKGMPGKYKIQVNYFGDQQVTIAGPTTVMAEIYLHYGTAKEERKVISLQMKKESRGEVFIGEVEL